MVGQFVWVEEAVEKTVAQIEGVEETVGEVVDQFAWVEEAVSKRVAKFVVQCEGIGEVSN